MRSLLEVCCCTTKLCYCLLDYCITSKNHKNLKLLCCSTTKPFYCLFGYCKTSKNHKILKPLCCSTTKLCYCLFGYCKTSKNHKNIKSLLPYSIINLHKCLLDYCKTSKITETMKKLKTASYVILCKTMHLFAVVSYTFMHQCTSGTKKTLDFYIMLKKPFPLTIFCQMPLSTSLQNIPFSKIAIASPSHYSYRHNRILL